MFWFPNLYSTPAGAPALCRFLCYLVVNSYAALCQLLFSWYLVVDWYRYLWRFLDNLPPHGGIWIYKFLSVSDLIILPPHGGLRICKALNGAGLVFLTGFWLYDWYFLHILIASLMHWSCGVFIPVEIRYFMQILIASLLHSSCGVFIPLDIIIIMGYLYPCPLLGVWIPCLVSHGIVRALLILLILVAITHDFDITVGLHFLFDMTNHRVAFRNTNISSSCCRCGTFFNHSAIYVVYSLLG